MASPGGSNEYYSTAATSPVLKLKSETSSEQLQHVVTPTATNYNNRNKKRRQQTLLSSSSSGGSDNSSSGVSLESGPTVETTPEMQALIEQRRKRRKDSNRESARRSRMRKQLHIDGMAAQVVSLRAENYKMLVMLERTTVGYLTIESENSVLRTQALELQSRLRSLNDIVLHMHLNMNMNMNMNTNVDANVDMAGDMMMTNSIGGFGTMPAGTNWGMVQQIVPLMPSLDVYQDCI